MNQIEQLHILFVKQDGLFMGSKMFSGALLELCRQSWTAIAQLRISLHSAFMIVFVKTGFFSCSHIQAFTKKLVLYASGSGSKRLHPKELFKMKIAFLSFKEQQQIADTWSTAQHEIDLLKQLVNKYKTHKRDLMQKMLTGKWRLKPEIISQYLEVEEDK